MKRILAIILLVAVLALVGYLCFTGSRLSNESDAGGVYEQTESV